MEKQEGEVKRMDSKSVIQEQIRNLQKLQDKVIEAAGKGINPAVYAPAACQLALTISTLTKEMMLISTFRC